MIEDLKSSAQSDGVSISVVAGPPDAMSAVVPGPGASPSPGEAAGGQSEPRIRPTLRRFGWRLGILLLVVAIVVPIWRAVTGHARPAEVAAPVHEPRTVAVARVEREDLYNRVTLTAEFRPYLQVELHAKVSGYVEQMKVDIGDRVKAGQLLANLEVPELRDELARAKAVEQRASADYKDAHLVYTRLQAVDKDHPNLVAQQELDAAEAKDATTEAAIASAKAEVQRIQTLQAYTRITAPFDGVVTRRYADPGALIQAGTASDTQSKPLVCLSDNYRLRLDFPVSVAYVKEVHVGDMVEVNVESLNGRSFTGKISRFAEKVDEDTRTMITEVEVPNPQLDLVPGMYATVALKVDCRPKALAVPTDALTLGQQPSVYVVNHSQELEERPVSLGLGTPSKYEVLSGLKEGDLVMIGNRSQVILGQKVRPKLIQESASL